MSQWLLRHRKVTKFTVYDRLIHQPSCSLMRSLRRMKVFRFVPVDPRASLSYESPCLAIVSQLQTRECSSLSLFSPWESVLLFALGDLDKRKRTRPAPLKLMKLCDGDFASRL